MFSPCLIFASLINVYFTSNIEAIFCVKINAVCSSSQHTSVKNQENKIPFLSQQSKQMSSARRGSNNIIQFTVCRQFRYLSWFLTKLISKTLLREMAKLQSLTFSQICYISKILRKSDLCKLEFERAQQKDIEMFRQMIGKDVFYDYASLPSRL